MVDVVDVQQLLHGQKQGECVGVQLANDHKSGLLEWDIFWSTCTGVGVYIGPCRLIGLGIWAHI